MATYDAKCEEFLRQIPSPCDFNTTKVNIETFIQFHDSDSKKIVLVTSGATTVPLEVNCVRYVDNCSSGGRGSASAEYFLNRSYAVIFLHRWRSLLPFHRHVQSTVLDDLMLNSNEDGASICDRVEMVMSNFANDHGSSDIIFTCNELSRSCGDGEVIFYHRSFHPNRLANLASTLLAYSGVIKGRQLLLVPFTSVFDYLHLLSASCLLLNRIGRRAIVYLSAAVSDFYLPPSQLPEHKIQSSDGPLQLTLHSVPKMLKPLVSEWSPNAFVISFKLETDHRILISKASQALECYRHQVVVANLLQTKKTEVVLVTMTTQECIRMSEEELSAGGEIERKIVDTLIEKHFAFLSCHQTPTCVP